MASIPSILRRAASGPIVVPVRAGGLNGWNAGGPLTITILPAGHEPGLYTVGVSLFVRTAATAGAFTGSVLAWNLPGVGNVTNAFVPSAPTTVGAKNNAYRSIPSTGLAAIEYRLAVVGITGSPVIDVCGYAELAAYNPG